MINRRKLRIQKKRGRRKNLPLINYRIEQDPKDKIMDQYEDNARNFKIKQENRQLESLVV